MKTPFTVGSAFASLALLGAFGGARAEDMFEPLGRPTAVASCPIGEFETCTRFQGYVVVGHGQPSTSGAGEESITSGPTSAGVLVIPEAPLGAERLYLKTGAGDTR